MSESMLPADADNSLDQTQSTENTETPKEPDVQELILGKFKTPDDVIKSYSELEKRFGGFKGAPEAYELAEDIDPEDTFVKALSEIGIKTNMSQETFGELFELGEKVLYTHEEVRQEREMELLGDDAQQRLANIDGFMRNNLGDKYEDLKGTINNAKTVELVEGLISATAPAKLPTGDAAPVNVPTQGDIERMMQEVDEKGKVIYHYSRSRQKEVQEAIARMQGR
jgi:hypothetical protein